MYVPIFYFVLPSSFLMFHEYFFCHFLSKISFRQFLVIGLLMTSSFSFLLYFCVFPQAYPLLVLIQLPESIGLCLWPHLWSFCHYFFKYCFCPLLLLLWWYEYWIFCYCLMGHWKSIVPLSTHTILLSGTQGQRFSRLGC